MERRSSQSSKLALLTQKNVFVFIDQIWHQKGLNQCSMAQKIQLTLFADFKTNLQKTTIYRERFFEKFQHLLCFPRKMVLYFLTKFCIFEPFTNIQAHRTFDLGFWSTSEQVYRKLQHGERNFAKFESQLWFPRKMVLYLLTKFSFGKA